MEESVQKNYTKRVIFPSGEQQQFLLRALESLNISWPSFRSYPLRLSVFNILKESGMNPRLNRGIDVRLDAIQDIRKYFDIINSHNPKHLKRYQK